MSEPGRTLLKWFGAKWIMAPRILPYFPAHRVYVESFGGGGSVLMRKPRSKVEVYNDMDAGLVNVFRVMRDPETAEQLRRACWLTPFARVEHELTYEPTTDPVEAARRFIFRSFSSARRRTSAQRPASARATTLLARTLAVVGRRGRNPSPTSASACAASLLRTGQRLTWSGTTTDPKRWSMPIRLTCSTPASRAHPATTITT